MFYDFHIHSCLSPCGDGDMTPGNIAGMAALCGLEAIAVADHNTCRNCPAVLEAARENGILAIPAMELTTSEEVHVLILLPNLDAALSLSDTIYECLPDIPVDPEIFGEQLLMAPGDKPAGTLSRLLLSATTVSIYEAAALAERFGGVAAPAHIDRPSFSLLGNLGLYDPDMRFCAFEMSPLAGADAIYAQNPDLRTLRVLRNSDAHTLEHMRDAEFSLAVERRSASAVIETLRGSAPHPA